MKAAVHTKYGLPGDIGIKEFDMPVPKPDELLIKVCACTVNRSDCHVLSGRPFIMRLFTGLVKPRATITGSDFAGQVAATGSAVSTFKVGDNVMGFGGGFGCGSHAEYFVVRESRANKTMVSMPAGMTYTEAAACLEGAVYAACALMPLKPVRGQKALVYGATGAIGSSYVQFLTYYGVSTTAVCGAENAALVKSLGADKVIDYRKDDFTKDPERYDFVFDAIGRSSFFKTKHLLKTPGIFTSSGGGENILLVLITPITGRKKVAFPGRGSIIASLHFIKDLIEQGFFKPVIDRTYPLDKIAEAFVYVASGQKTGNVIIAMDV